MTIYQSATHRHPIKEEFRGLLQQRRQQAKKRQQSMLVRLEAELDS